MTTDTIAGVAGSATPIHPAPTSTRRAELAEEFRGQADWRRQKAIQYADDDRNDKAADILEKLADSVDAMPGDLLGRLDDVWHQADENDLPDLCTLWSDNLRGIGFSAWPATAEEFCRAFVEGARPDDTEGAGPDMVAPGPHVGGWPLWKPPAAAQPTIAPQPADMIFSVIQWHRRTVKAADAAIEARNSLEDDIPEERRRAAYRWSGTGWQAAREGPDDDERWTAAQAACNAASAEEMAAADSLLKTPPTSLAGVLALAGYAVELAADDGGWPSGTWDLAGEQPRREVGYEGVLFRNIREALRATLPGSVVEFSDIVVAFGMAPPERAEKALQILRDGQRNDGAHTEAGESAA